MAGQRDGGDFEITREEVKFLEEALKKEEFRKLLTDYAKEVTDPENKKKFQEDIIQLEAERGVDCTFINPEPGFVVKTSVDGKKKAFINICKNENIGKPSSKAVMKDNSRGLSWSIPYSQCPGREDLDNKRNQCLVYDVVFHPDTLHLAEKNNQFKKMVIDTAVNAVEDSFKVSLDKKNMKFPKLKYKGMAHASVIRRKSENPVILCEEDKEFHEQIKLPEMSAPLERDAKFPVKDLSNIKESVEKYTVPHYVIKHRSSVEMEEFTYHKNARINCAIPKELVLEIYLPLLNTTKEVTLDVTEQAVHLFCEKPAKYKLDITLPYRVSEQLGSAQFDKEKRVLLVVLPVIRSTPSAELSRDDSGVESDGGERSLSSDDEPKCLIQCVSENNFINKEAEDNFWTKEAESKFLDCDKHYLLPPYSCNMEDNTLCFVLNVRNVDPTSIKKLVIDSRAVHVKFSSIGSGFFPTFYAFYVKIDDGCLITDEECVDIEAWDNNVILQLKLNMTNAPLHQYWVGIDEADNKLKTFDELSNLRKMMEELQTTAEDVFREEPQVSLEVVSATCDKVVVSISAEDSSEAPAPVPESAKPVVPPVVPPPPKCRAYSESNTEDLAAMSPVRKSILKNRVSRSLSESSADDYPLSSSVEGTWSGSDLCIPEKEDTKKTVRFSDNIRKQLFRVNSSILGQRKKNQKRGRNKRKAQERRASESENSEGDEKEGKVGMNGEGEREDCEESEVNATVIPEESDGDGESSPPTRGAPAFSSDLIFHLDI